MVQKERKEEEQNKKQVSRCDGDGDGDGGGGGGRGGGGGGKAYQLYIPFDVKRAFRFASSSSATFASTASGASGLTIESRFWNSRPRDDMYFSTSRTLEAAKLRPLSLCIVKMTDSDRKTEQI
jgi:hypothetical protein